MSALKPGLYRATVRGVADATVLIDGHGLGTTANEINGKHYHGPELITDAELIDIATAFNPAA